MIGGFSIASSPSECVKTDELMMSIKYSQHPPAHYMHHTASVGNVLPVRVGGDVYYDPKKQRRLLLIAGGIGITPLRAIMAQATSTPATIASLMYSATSFEDVLYKVRLRWCMPCFWFIV
jgi:ferredoxin-NADP reductase